MATKTRETSANTKDTHKRTVIKDLAEPERKLDRKGMKKVKGSIVGPCSVERRYR